MTQYVHTIVVQTTSPERPNVVEAGSGRRLNIVSDHVAKVRRRYRYMINATVEIDESERFGCSSETALKEHLLLHLMSDQVRGGCWHQVEQRNPNADVDVRRVEL